MRFPTAPAPHIPPRSSVAGVMFRVHAALIPGVIAYVALFGFAILVQIALAVATALACEAAMLALRRKPVAPFLEDGSAALTGVLLALALPPPAPFWLPIVGTAFAVIVAKHLYGGLGYNPFNPAMAGYAALLVSFPTETTLWPAPDAAWLGPVESLRLVFTGETPGLNAPDALTGATILDYTRTQVAAGHTVTELAAEPVFGMLGGARWEWLSAAYLAGGAYLLAARVIRWQIPVAMLAALFILAGLFHLLDPDRFLGPVTHLFSGAAMLGAFFIATDPVSASTTPRGRLVFGAGVGALTFLLRGWGGYPDGVAFAVLLMNLAVPVIDRYTRPRVYGRQR